MEVKRIISFILAIAMLFSFAACGKNQTTKPEDEVKDNSQVIEPPEENEGQIEITPVVTNECTVTFYCNYGNNDVYKIVSVESGKTVDEPEDPEREGYSFDGWYTAEKNGEKFDFDTVISEDITLYAQWHRNSSGGGVVIPTPTPDPEPTPDDAEKTTYTRGQWIKLLIDTYGYPECNVDENFYADITNSEYTSEINSAVAYGILPSTGGDFNPNETATREFAANTAVKSMGYVIPDIEINCADVDAITDPKIAYLAVDLGLLMLEDNMYHPARALSESECVHIMDILEETYRSTILTDDEGDGYVFLEDVNVLESVTTHHIDDDTVQLPLISELENLQVGDIVVNGTDSAYKVDHVEYNDTSVEITYTVPELHEFLDYIDIQGEGYLDYSQFIPAEGVNVTYNSAQQIQTFAWYDGVVNVPDTEIDLDIDLVLEGEIDMGSGWKTKYELEFGLPSASYKVDVDFNPISGILPGGTPLVDVRNTYLKIEEQIGATVNIGKFADDIGLLDDPFFKEVTLGYVPLIGTNGFGALVEVNLVVNAQGSVEFKYNVAGVLGCQVLNNRPRNLSALDSSASVGVTGEIKIGPELYVVAEVFDKNIISFGADAGARLGGGVYARSTGMICVDGSLSAYAELSAFDRCLLDEWLNIAIKWTIWDENNSPLKKGFHFENMVIVPECTYSNSAIIRGTVANAENRTQYIENAEVEVRHFTTMELMNKEYSDANGRYTATVPGGTYLLNISADGYIPFQSRHTVSEGQDIFVETFLMVAGEEGTDEVGTIGGCITNAVTGSSIEGVQLTIRKGWNQTEGEIITTVSTNSDGSYSVELPLGNYTVQMEKSTYVSDHFNVAVTKSTNRSWHGTLNPSEESTIPTGDLRIILTWGEYPSDLDSHLWGPTSDGIDRFHICYYDMEYVSEDVVHSFLDLDDTSSYGPETTTIYSMNQHGKYSFYVHDFTNQGNETNTELANSGAKVAVYVGEQVVATYHIPTHGVGDVWHVFDFDADSRLFTPINTFTTVGDASMVGVPNSGIQMFMSAPAK